MHELQINDRSTARRPRLTILHWMAAVAVMSLVFALFGVNWPVATVIAAFVASALVMKPQNWQEWLVLLLGAIGSLPPMLVSAFHVFALRKMLFAGSWPVQFEFLEVLIPGVVSVLLTSLVVIQARYAPSSDLAMAAAIGIPAVFWLLSLSILLLDPFGVMNWIIG